MLSPSDRLRALSDILVSARISACAPRDAGDEQLSAVPFERIQRLTEFLNAQAHTIDDVDALSANLLLNDLTVAIAHVQALTQLAASRISAAGGALKPARNFLHRQAKVQEKFARRSR